MVIDSKGMIKDSEGMLIDSEGMNSHRMYYGDGLQQNSLSPQEGEYFI